MKTSSEQQQKIRLLSDKALYRDALDFITEQGTVEGLKQMNSLVIYTQSWQDLVDFVKHQREREWTGQREYYKQFYTALEEYLTNLRKRVVDEWFPLPPDRTTKAEIKAWQDHFAILVAREFVHHLAAENLYRRKLDESKFYKTISL